MQRLILISATAILLVASPPLRADELKLTDFPVSGERMAELIELAADGNLTIPDAEAPKAPMAARQVSFLRHVLTARKMALLGAKPTTDPAVGSYRSLVDLGTGDACAADLCYRAVMAARSGNTDAADVLLEKSFAIKCYDSDNYCNFLYRRWNGNTLNYRFLRWWAQHVSGPDRLMCMVTLMAAAQLLALPLLLKLRHAIITGRRGWALVGLALAAAFVEAVPYYWAAASVSATIFANEDNRNEPHWFDIVFVLFAHFASFVVFMIWSRGVIPRWMRIGLGIVLFFCGTILVMIGAYLAWLPFLVMRGRDNISEAAVGPGAIFWSGILPLSIYFLLLLRRERLRRRPI